MNPTLTAAATSKIIHTTVTAGEADPPGCGAVPKSHAEGVLFGVERAAEKIVRLAGKG